MAGPHVSGHKIFLWRTVGLVRHRKAGFCGAPIQWCATELSSTKFKKLCCCLMTQRATQPSGLTHNVYSMDSQVRILANSLFFNFFFLNLVQKLALSHTQCIFNSYTYSIHWLIHIQKLALSHTHTQIKYTKKVFFVLLVPRASFSSFPSSRLITLGRSPWDFFAWTDNL